MTKNSGGAYIEPRPAGNPALKRCSVGFFFTSTIAAKNAKKILRASRALTQVFALPGFLRPGKQEIQRYLVLRNSKVLST